MGPVAWDILFGNIQLALAFGFFRLGISVWTFRLGDLSLVTFAWKLSFRGVALGIFRLELFWSLRLGIVAP